MKRLVTFLALSMLVQTALWSSDRGTTAADYLKVNKGALATGMGEAVTARLGDPNAAYYNPAGLALMPMAQLSATHLNWIAETRMEAVNFIQPFLELGTLGVGVFGLHMPGIPGRDVNGLDTEPLNAYDMGLQLSYARDISPLVGLGPIYAGANLKVLYRQLAGLSAAGVAADIGLIMEVMDHWTVGLSLQNMGYLSGFDQAAENLPMIGRLGTQYYYEVAPDHRLTAAVDVVQSMDSTVKANVGLEYCFAHMLALRGGYKLGYDSDGFQAGLGVHLGAYALDYAVESMGVFGLTHFITASVGLGTSIEKAKDDKVKALLEKAETQFTHSRYQEALKIVEQAVLIDPKNIRANELKEKLATVLQMLDSTPQASPEEESPQVNKDGVPLTPDEREELGGVSPKEVRP